MQETSIGYTPQSRVLPERAVKSGLGEWKAGKRLKRPSPQKRFGFMKQNVGTSWDLQA